MIAIDGRDWDVPCRVERTADMTPSEASGMLMDGSYFNDVIGTYLTYNIVMAIPPRMDREYADLYEDLTEPVSGHVFRLPYNRGTVTVVARVESVKDVLVWTTTGKQYWRGLSFTVIANHPTKYLSYEEIVSRAISPLPNAVQVPYGTTFTATEGGWQETQFGDADARRY